ncbi:MAG: hypothetical protein H0V00_13690 [Chloroflexia bacterium]|nr:hypothetical protein [Chloroflexia bacterium]
MRASAIVTENALTGNATVVWAMSPHRRPGIEENGADRNATRSGMARDDPALRDWLTSELKRAVNQRVPAVRARARRLLVSLAAE